MNRLPTRLDYYSYGTNNKVSDNLRRELLQQYALVKQDDKAQVTKQGSRASAGFTSWNPNDPVTWNPNNQQQDQKGQKIQKMPPAYPYSTRPTQPVQPFPSTWNYFEEDEIATSAGQSGPSIAVDLLQAIAKKIQNK